jgi:murein DD-endopeptidase MepM/ murein hydrolase activator NlpD
LAATDPYALSYPYDNYWLTQGLHGASYGHAAIDLAAGKGSAVKSPLDGQVTANYVDGYHSHLNVFSKEQSVNVNPLDVLH